MNAWIRAVLFPVEGTAYARDVDQLNLFLIWFGIFFFVLVAGLLAFFVVKYRRRSPDDRTPNLTHHTGLEVTWTLIPLGLVMLIFFWGFRLYIRSQVAPADAMEIQVTARKWVWTFEYPNGVRTINELHVPVGKPVKLVMSSEDVIHSFYVPTFRIKQDVVPGTYTQFWFRPEVLGTHQLECAEYCGKGHSEMLGKIYVEDQKKYEDWMENGGDLGKNMPPAQFGALLYQSKGCETCHSLNGTPGDGPSFKGVFGHMVNLNDGRTVRADENYIRESILQPQAKIVAGFGPIMPTFQGVLREREINALIAFIKQQSK